MISNLKKLIIPFLNILLAGFAVYAISLDFTFLVRSDDTAYIFRNPYLQNISLKNLGAIFSNLHYGDYLPVTLLSYSWDFTWWGFEPFGYRLTQVILHVSNASLLFVILRVLKVSQKVCLFSAIIFVVHPVQVESVVWISERKNLLSSFFILLSLWFYLRHVMNSCFKRFDYYLCMITFLLALLSKSIAVMLPCIFVLLDMLVLKRKIRVMEKIPYFLMSLIVGLGTIYSQGAMGAIKEYAGGSFAVSLLYTLRVYWDYLVSLAFPFQLSPMYYFDSISPTDPRSFLAYLVFCGTCYFVIRNFRSHPGAIFILGWFVLWLFPVSNFIPISVLRQDRYLYLPSISVIVAVAIWFESLGKQKMKGNWINIIMIGWVLVLGAISFSHSFVYASENSYWNRIVSQNPDSAHAHLEAGYQCKLIDDLDCAEKHYRQALAIRPEYVQALNNLGATMTERGQFQKAQTLIEEAIRIDPTYPVAYKNRIILAEKSGSGRENVPRWKRKYDLFSKMNSDKDYLLGAFRFH